jgi:hypothetical protein
MAGSSTRVRSASGGTTASSTTTTNTSTGGGGGTGGHPGRFGRHRTGGRATTTTATSTNTDATSSMNGGSNANNNQTSNPSSNIKTSSGGAMNTSSNHEYPANNNNVHNNSNNASKQRKNVSFLLARGGTARGLPSHHLLLSTLTPLRADEMEKDLRHMQVYANAVQSYQQQFYLHCNQGMLLAEQQQQAQLAQQNAANAANAATAGVVPGMANNVATAPLHHQQQPHYNAHHHAPMMSSTGVVPMHHMPIRIDPEEEKRLATLRKKIAKAEIWREELESQYVASRAHYVHEVQRVATATSSRKRVLLFLQAAVGKKSQVVALQRVRLQMARDVLHALRWRRHQVVNSSSTLAQQPTAAAVAATTMYTPASSIDATGSTTATTMVAVEIDSTANETVAAAVEATKNTTSTTTTTSTSTTSSIPPHLSGDDPMATQWNAVEDDYKKAATSCIVDKKTKKAMPWPCTHLPVTPRGVPTLLSAMSRAPDKTIAFALSCKNGSVSSASTDKNKQSLVWLEDNLPLDHYRVVDQPGKENSSSSSTAASTKKSDPAPPPQQQPDEYECELPTLSQRVEALERELVKERQLNQELCHKIGQSRKHADERVAFLGILRQETESVVQRHNTLLESDTALEALERLHEGEEDDEEEEETPDQEVQEHVHEEGQKHGGAETEQDGQEKITDAEATDGAKSMISATAESGVELANGDDATPHDSTATATDTATADVPSLDHVPRKKAVDKETSSSSEVTPGAPVLAHANNVAAPVATAVADEEANDGDDEDSNEEGEVQEDDEEEGEVQEDDDAAKTHDDWEAPSVVNNTATLSSSSNKRSAADEQEHGAGDNNDDSPGRKRRKL